MTPGDHLILVLALIVLGFLYWILWLNPTGAASYAELHVEGRNQIIDLYKDQVIEVKGRLGTSRIQVKNGAVRFIQSPCKGKYCIYSSWLRYAGEVTACLPNGILLSIPGKEQYDTINF